MRPLRAIHLTTTLFVITIASLLIPAHAAERPAQLPVREITVFKDGHAFVLHSGRMPVDAQGNVRMDYLPTPVLGTFWPYSTDKNVKLVSVTGSSVKGTSSRTALTLADLLEANPGAKAEITTTDKQTLTGEIVSVPRQEPEYPLSPAPSAEGQRYTYDYSTGTYRALNQEKNGPGKAPETLLFKSGSGTVALPLTSVKSIAFKGDFHRNLEQEEYRNQLSLKLNRPDGRLGTTADVGLVYLQKGIRWIPSYRISIDGKGNATVKLQATILNEMVDFQDVTANLVVGVPTFYFKDSPDPISLQQTFPQLSKFFQSDSQTGFAFSNAIMGQGGFGGGLGGGQGGGFGGNRCGGDLENPSVLEAGQQEPVKNPLETIGADKNEDLYVFTIKHISLKKGETLVIPVAEFPLKYKDVFSIEVPIAPPQEVQRNQNREQEAELARLLRQPKVQHKIRLMNKSAYPLTTAPALIVNGDKVVAQGLMTFTPVGAESDVTLTTSNDIRVKKTEKLARTIPPNTDENKREYSRRQMTGTLTVTSYREQSVDLEVVRFVPGKVDKVDNGGEISLVNAVDDENYVRRGDYPYWWSWYNWPYWWDEYNGLSKVTWKLKLEPGKSLDLSYEWHYFWQ